MNFSFITPFFYKLLLFILIIVLAIDWVEIVILPVPHSCISPMNLFICHDLLVMIFKIFVGNDVIVLVILVHIYRNLNFEFLAVRSFFWSLEMVIL